MTATPVSEEVLDVPVTSSFAKLVHEGLEILQSANDVTVEDLFHSPGVSRKPGANALTSMIMCLTLACSARDKANPGWLDS